MLKIKELSEYPPIHRIFDRIYDQQDVAFLDSSLKNQLGRWSVIGLHPYLKLVKDQVFTVNGEVIEEDFSDYVKTYLKEQKRENPTGLPLVSGAIGYFSYDYGRERAGVQTRHEKAVDIPECVLNFYDDFIIEDHEKKRLYLIANGKKSTSEKAMEKLQKLVEQAARTEADHLTRLEARGVRADFGKEDYMHAVESMINYIIEGDIYITNMTQQLKIESRMHPYAVFRRLRRDNPSPFGGYFNFGSFQVVSASPERFLKMKGGHVKTRPIKGTRKRGADPCEDEAMRLELLESEKDKSELLMIVDLERNDLNRVCVPGSVEVTELFTVEAYATVFHLVSNVEGDLRPGLTAMDLIEAAFPGGSITGAPKLRAMEIIDELEQSRRNLYTGSMGYLSLDGDCDFNIVIRTALHQDGFYHLGVGGGITFESEPGFEYEETLQKAKAILEALNGTDIPFF